MQDKTSNHTPIPTELNIAPRGKSWLHGQLIDGEHGYPTRQSMENAERAAFEKWARFFGTWDVERDDDPNFSTTGYTDITVNVAWLAWQARAALDATPACDTPNYCRSVQRCTAMDGQRAAAAPVVLPEHWGVCVGGRIWIGKTPEHVLKLAEQERMNPTLLFTEQQLRALLATATGLPAQAVEDGWKLVPSQPTKMMVQAARKVDARIAGKRERLSTDEVWAIITAALSSTPQPPATTPQAQADAREAQLLAFAVSEIRRDEMGHAPVLYVSKGQLDNHRDPDGPDSTAHGRYLPARVTPSGKFTTPLFAVPQEQAFQQRVQPWMMACFGPEISADRIERNHRFLEEALELVQSCGCTASEAHQLVDYVYGRPWGEPAQEAGGVMVTLAALCLANDLDMHASGETELARIWTKVEAIRAKQAAKPKHSPLPEHAPQAQEEARAAESDYQRGYRHGYNRRDAEVQGALL